MRIAFFENFANDVPTSIMSRYPGTQGFLYGPYIGGIPLMRYATSTSSVNDGILEFGSNYKVPERRLDLLIRYNDNGDTTGQGNNAGQQVFYNNLRIYATSATNIRIDHSPYSGTNWFRDITVPNVKSVREVYILVDYLERSLSVMVDGDFKLVKVPVESWVFVDNLNNNLVVDALSSGIQNTWMPNFLENIVIAMDLPEGQMLDPSSINFHLSPLSLGQVGNMEYSETSYVTDVNKSDPTPETPGVYTEDEGFIQYTIDKVENSLASKVYAAGRSDLGRYMEVGAVDGRVEHLEPYVTVFPVHEQDEEDILVQVSRTMPWINNGLGMSWGGEVDLIKYADLCDLLGFTDGILMGENSWLRFKLDGQELYVAKTPVRHSVSWNQIYYAGLVYGMHGPGISPGSPPIDQNRTIEIDGRIYRVRILKGADTDPGTAPNGVDDPVGTHNSEWTRLFAPIAVTNFPSYTGPKFASYTDAELGVGGSLPGRGGWCQEINANSSARLFRGSLGLSRTVWGTPSIMNTGNGWRPVLELVV